MLGKHKLLLLIPAILLIPILLGMTPLNLAHKLASGGPFTHCKQVQWSNHCPFHSIASHNDLPNVSLNTTPLFQGLSPIHESQISLLDFFQPNIFFKLVSLRC